MAEKKNTRNDKDKRKDADVVEEEVNGKKTKKEKHPSDPSSIGNQVITVALFALALFVGICFILPSAGGVIGKFIFEGLFGIFGGSAILVPFLLLNHAIFHKRDVESGAVCYKWSFSVLTVFLLSMIVHSILGICKIASPDETLSSLFENGQKLVGGGAVGGKCELFLAKGIGDIGVLIFSLTFFIILSIFLFGLTPAMFFERAKFYAVHRMEKREEIKKKKRQQAENKKEEEKTKMPERRDVPENPKRRRGDIDDEIFYDDDPSVEEKKPAPAIDDMDDYGLDDKPEENEKEVRTETILPVPKKEYDDDLGLDSIFDVPESEEAKEKFSRKGEEYYDPEESEAQAEIKVKKEALTPTRPQRPAREPKQIGRAHV